MRELLVAVGFSALVLIPFLLFVSAGWPGQENSCVTNRAPGQANSCYCEEFDRTDILQNRPGVRQPFNTWSNLYALVTGGIVAWFVYKNRKSGAGGNRMVSTNLYPLLYIAVVIFLGLGSMWFHGSMTQWGGVFDNLSMYTFTNFMIFYTLVRLTDNDKVFYIGYPAATLLLTILAIAGVSSLILTIISVAAYLAAELIIWIGMPRVRNDLKSILKFWLTGVAAIGLAVAVWLPSQTGGPLCLDTHMFQFHGLWHILAGVTAVLLYFYWRASPR